MLVAEQALGNLGGLPFATREHVLETIEMLDAGQQRLVTEAQVAQAHVHALAPSPGHGRKGGETPAQTRPGRIGHGVPAPATAARHEQLEHLQATFRPPGQRVQRLDRRHGQPQAVGSPRQPRHVRLPQDWLPVTHEDGLEETVPVGKAPIIERYRLVAHGDQVRPKISDPLVPPKPKEFDRV